jgi:hypothetical protein
MLSLTGDQEDEGLLSFAITQSLKFAEGLKRNTMRPTKADIGGAGPAECSPRAIADCLLQRRRAREARAC